MDRQEALKLVEQDGMELGNLAAEYQRDKEVCRAAICKKPDAVQFVMAPLIEKEMQVSGVRGIPGEFGSDFSFADLYVYAVTKKPELIAAVPEEYRNANPLSYWGNALTWNGLLLEEMMKLNPEHINEYCVAAATNQTPSAWQYVPVEYMDPERIVRTFARADIDVAREGFDDLEQAVLQKTGLSVREFFAAMPEESASRISPEEALRALSKEPRMVAALPRQQEALMLTAVAVQPQVLKYIDDPSVALCKSAVKRDGMSLQYVPEHMRTEEVIRIALEQNLKAAAWATSLTSEQRLAVLSTHGELLPHLAKMQEPTSKEYTLAVRSYPSALKWVPEEAQTKDLVLDAVSIDATAMRYIAVPALREDKDMLEAAQMQMAPMTDNERKWIHDLANEEWEEETATQQKEYEEIYDDILRDMEQRPSVYWQGFDEKMSAETLADLYTRGTSTANGPVKMAIDGNVMEGVQAHRDSIEQKLTRLDPNRFNDQMPGINVYINGQQITRKELLSFIEHHKAAFVQACREAFPELNREIQERARALMEQSREQMVGAIERQRTDGGRSRVSEKTMIQDERTAQAPRDEEAKRMAREELNQMKETFLACKATRSVGFRLKGENGEDERTISLVRVMDEEGRDDVSFVVGGEPTSEEKLGKILQQYPGQGPAAVKDALEDAERMAALKSDASFKTAKQEIETAYEAFAGNDSLKRVYVQLKSAEGNPRENIEFTRSRGETSILIDGYRADERKAAAVMEKYPLGQVAKALEDQAAYTKEKQAEMRAEAQPRKKPAKTKGGQDR